MWVFLFEVTLWYLMCSLWETVIVNWCNILTSNITLWCALCEQRWFIIWIYIVTLYKIFYFHCKIFMCSVWEKCKLLFCYCEIFHFVWEVECSKWNVEYFVSHEILTLNASDSVWARDFYITSILICGTHIIHYNCVMILVYEIECVIRAVDISIGS